MSSQLLRGSIKLASALTRSSASSRQLILMSNGPKHLSQPAAFISTSKKKQDLTITAEEAQAQTKAEEEIIAKAKKNWVSYGFSWRSEEEDVNMRNTIMFWTVTVALVGISFQIAYFPDVRGRNWIHREAYIELSRREALGLPPVDGNLVPPSNINLPTEEELGDFDIII